MPKSWDVWDTLIGRKCGTPMRLWEKMSVDMDNFPTARNNAAIQLYRTGREHTLADIYDVLRRPDLLEAEWEAEKSNVFLIPGTADQIQDGDVLVSDSYLTEDQTRELLRIAGFDKDVHLIVTCYGKRLGTAWNQARQYGEITSHYGDNWEADVCSPQRAMIPGLHFRESGLSAIEQFYSHWGSEDFAWFIRRWRLANPYGSTNQGFLWHWQAKANFPMLHAACAGLAGIVSSELREPVFLARDACLLGRLWSHLYKILPGRILWTSRELFRRPSASFIEYFRKFTKDDDILVDLRGTGRSYAAFCENHGAPSQPIVYVLLDDGYNIEIESPRRLRLTSAIRCPNDFATIEMFNLALHGRALDVSADGTPTFDDATEDYDHTLVAVAHRMMDEALPEWKLFKLADWRAVLEFSIQLAASHAKRLGELFPMHGMLEDNDGIRVNVNDPSSLGKLALDIASRFRKDSGKP